jgi:hypothetical protein
MNCSKLLPYKLEFRSSDLVWGGAGYRYEAIGSNLLEDHGFSTHPKHWQLNRKQFMAFSVGDNSLTMSIPPGKDTVNISVLQAAADFSF